MNEDLFFKLLQTIQWPGAVVLLGPSPTPTPTPAPPPAGSVHVKNGDIKINNGGLLIK